MFTGIIEQMGEVVELQSNQNNLEIWFKAPFTNALKIDQSVAHNGVCLTVDKIKGDVYRITAIKETLERSNIGQLKAGDFVNLERCLKADGRFDGHIVQGHVDTTAICFQIEDQNGSTNFHFEYPEGKGLTVEKGSITVNGISLTVVRSESNVFSVSIIPYTLEQTNLAQLKVGDEVNIEFDIVGKYLQKIHQ